MKNWIIFLCISITHCVHPLIRWWRLKLLSLFGFYDILQGSCGTDISSGSFLVLECLYRVGINDSFGNSVFSFCFWATAVLYSITLHCSLFHQQFIIIQIPPHLQHILGLMQANLNCWENSILLFYLSLPNVLGILSIFHALIGSSSSLEKMIFIFLAFLLFFCCMSHI